MLKIFTQALFIVMFLSSVSIASDEVPRISKEELKSKIESNADIVIFDVRSAIAGDKFDTFIKNAIRVPIVEIYNGKALPEDKTKEIILYCV